MPDPEEVISHFKIWDVTPEQMDVSTKVFLTDQSQDHKREPKYLGVPVKKEGVGEPKDWINRDAHPAIYELNKKERRKFSVQYQVLDQFVPGKGATVTVNESHYLAIPSKKNPIKS